MDELLLWLDLLVVVLTNANATNADSIIVKRNLGIPCTNFIVLVVVL
jgi:hypothetical protein